MNNTLQKIEESLDSIRPYLEADGGDIKIVEYTNDHKLTLEFIGQCSQCPMSNMTFKTGVEEAIRKSVPEVGEIVVINLTT